MVLESLTNPREAERHSAYMILYGFAFALTAIILSLWIFREYASLVMVFLTVMGCLPLMAKTLRYEEHKDLDSISEKKLLVEHGRAIKFFMFLFFGFVLAFVAVYVLVPGIASTFYEFPGAAHVAQKVPLLKNLVMTPDEANALIGDLFKVQVSTIQNINGNVTGNATASVGVFARVFFNNLKVMMFCILFSFFYGSGAIFILAWNASVIGAFVGSFINVNIAQYALHSGFTKIAAYFQVALVGFAKLSVHGIPEIMAYFVAGLAGGIISEAIINHDLSTKNFEKIVLDSADLILISIGLLLVAGMLEVWVSPALF